jgi:hypothetical protein
MQQQLQQGRTKEQRKKHALQLLEDPSVPHILLATANPDGRTAHQRAMTFVWDGERLTMGMVEPQRTAENLRRTGWAQGHVGANPTLDAVVVEGEVTLIPVDEIDPAIGDALKARWSNPNIDFREMPGFVFAQLRPDRIQVYRPGYVERTNRTLMRHGAWLV